jgi:enterochelin esterase-like enzyme
MRPAATSELSVFARVRRVDWRTAVAASVSSLRGRPPVVTIAVVAAIGSTFLRLQVGGQLPEGRLFAEGFSARSLGNGEVARLLTSTLLTRDIFMTISIAVSLLVTLGAYEVIAGHVRAALVAVIAAVAGPVGVATGLGVLNSVGIRWALTPMGTVDIGASAIVAGAAGALPAVIGRRRVTSAVVLFVLSGLLVHHQLADWELVVAFPVGLLLGRLAGARPARAGTRRRSTVYATVALLATVAASAAATRALPAPSAGRDPAGHTVSAQRLMETTYPAPALGETRRVTVLLPPGYDSSTARYPVIEVLHGIPGQPRDLLSVGALQRSALSVGVQPFVALLPDGHGPHRSDGWYANIPTRQLGTAVGADLRRWANATLRISYSWSYAGLSAGGFGAAYLAIMDRQPVHSVCGLSGYYTANIPPLAGISAAVRDRSDPTRQVTRAPSLTLLAYGNSDTRSEQDAMTYAAALRATGRSVIQRSYPGGHQWAVWAPALVDCFHVVLPGTLREVRSPGYPVSGERHWIGVRFSGGSAPLGESCRSAPGRRFRHVRARSAPLQPSLVVVESSRR